MKQPLTDTELLQRYRKKRDYAERQFRQTALRSSRIIRTMAGWREELLRIERIVDEIGRAISQGVPYRKPKEPKKKRGRHIELE